MPRKQRIILILAAGTLTTVLLLALGNRPTDSASTKYGWRAQLKYLYYDLKNALPWNRGQPASVNSCIANLKQIVGAKATWALEQKKSNSDIPTTNELYGVTNYIRDMPVCPRGGTYTLGRVDQKVRCSIPGHTL
jgi:hypothetical protein